MTRMEICVGPPCTIVLCKPAVLMTEMPAAFLGSVTDHGGAVIIGQPTVLGGIAHSLLPTALLTNRNLTYDPDQ